MAVWAMIAGDGAAQGHDLAFGWFIPHLENNSWVIKGCIVDGALSTVWLDALDVG